MPGECGGGLSNVIRFGTLFFYKNQRDGYVTGGMTVAL
jgi:hypothetical protein